ncbi:LuxR C-terminal-related transcriptional regulator [Mycobacterium sp. C3-094]|uniref:LuxR C-terminal-related transcriptional regulator n=1 Tax=Mycobacterium sp. PSTR-4-N TaxID=2917745 RepID=UPI001F14D597|nr:response regulator transcription factor [Mycobacterium sp. PSTR-4-N]MCG7595417.1 response regulator transcription factor [Mycobacterium sp. PSTR-4-N]
MWGTLGRAQLPGDIWTLLDNDGEKPGELPVGAPILSGGLPIVAPHRRRTRLVGPCTADGADLELPVGEILIIDDSRLQRDNLSIILAGGAASRPIAAWNVDSLSAALDMADPGSPCIVLLNLMTHGSITLLHLVRELRPAARVIVIGVTESDEADVIACAEAGVAGYHLRSESLGELRTLIARVANGESRCPTVVSTILLKHLSAMAGQRRHGPSEPDLTAREMQILRMLEDGLSNRDIAERLCITLHTVKNHVHGILSKLGVRTRAEAAALSRSLR